MDEMRLIDYLIEAVSGRTKRSQTPYLYTRFPNKRTDFLGIEKWLDENGFVKRELGHEHTPPKLFEYHKSTGRKCYAIGEHDPKSVFSYWIRIWDGNKLFLIRTAPRDMVRQQLPSSMALCTVVDNYKGDESFNGKYIKFDEIKKYFDEAVVYMNESVAGHSKLHRAVKHTRFPRDRKDDKAIDKWLEDNNFVRLKSGFGGPVSDPTLFGYDINCYTRGLYDKFNIGTWWYKIWDGERLICIRTCDDAFFNKRRLKPVEAYDNRDYPIDMSYSDVVEYFDSKVINK